MPQSLAYWDDRLGKSVAREEVFTYVLTSGAMVPKQAYPVLLTTGALTQATIDAFLGSSTEVNYLNFDATSMGTDALGIIVNMAGQVKSLEYVEFIMRSGTGNVTTVRRYATAADVMVNTQLAVAEAEKSSSGNVSARCVITSLDSTTGYLTVKLGWISK